MLYVIKRIYQGGGYVALPGSRNTYTNSVRRMQTYDTYEQADAARCPDNEVVVSARDLLPNFN